MGAPIFVDDGGSIRLKLVSNESALNGEMESLLNVDDHGHSEHDIDPDYGTYGEVVIFWVDAAGELKRTTPPIYPCNKVTITTDTGQKVEFKTNPNNRISLDGGPFLDSKQHNGKRSYTILNGGRIEKIEVQPGNRSVSNQYHDFIYFAALIREESTQTSL